MSQSMNRARTEHAKEQKRQKLMDAAMDLFIERGYKTPTVEMITERAGTSVGTFYLYFRGKHEIYKAFQKEAIDLLSGMILQGLAKRSGSAREKLIAAAAAYLRFYREYPEYYGFIALINIGGQQELRESKSEIGEIVDSTTLAILRRVEAVITEGIRGGEFRQVDAWRTACALWGMIDGCILIEERGNTRVIGMTLDELVWHGLETAFSGVDHRGVPVSP
jgi:AcrR family transcriptional regulator